MVLQNKNIKSSSSKIRCYIKLQHNAVARQFCFTNKKKTTMHNALFHSELDLLDMVTCTDAAQRDNKPVTKKRSVETTRLSVMLSICTNHSLAIPPRGTFLVAFRRSRKVFWTIAWLMNVNCISIFVQFLQENPFSGHRRGRFDCPLQRRTPSGAGIAYQRQRKALLCMLCRTPTGHVTTLVIPALECRAEQ